MSGNELISDFAFDFFVLAGDADRSGTVDTIDFNVLAANFGQPGKTPGQGNFDYDAAGIVDTLDFNLLASNLGMRSRPGATRRLAGFVPPHQQTGRKSRGNSGLVEALFGDKLI